MANAPRSPTCTERTHSPVPAPPTIINQHSRNEPMPKRTTPHPRNEAKLTLYTLPLARNEVMRTLATLPYSRNEVMRTLATQPYLRNEPMLTLIALPPSRYEPIPCTTDSILQARNEPTNQCIAPATGTKPCSLSLQSGFNRRLPLPSGFNRRLHPPLTRNEPTQPTPSVPLARNEPMLARGKNRTERSSICVSTFPPQERTHHDGSPLAGRNEALSDCSR